MYIKKTITTQYGIDASYHVLGAIHTYYNLGVSHIDISGYFTEEAYKNGAIAVATNQVEINKTSFVNEKDIYEAVLSTEFFKDGILCE